MGVSDLRDIAVIDEVAFDELEGSVVAVDAHNWLYKYLTTTVRWTNESVYTTAEGEEVANLVGVVQGLPKFFEHDLTPVFVFDGGVTELKEAEIAERREQRERAEAKLEEAKEAGDAIEAARYDSQSQRLTDVIQRTTREIFDILDVPYVEAPAEGEAQAAFMARTDPEIGYAGTDDYDSLLLGAPFTLRQLTSKGNPELMEFQATLDEHGISWEQLVDLAILMGTDFNDGIRGYGPKTALKAIKEHGDLETVLEMEGEEVEHADRIRAMFLDPEVTDEYDIDLSLDPDVAAARAYVSEEWGIPADEVARGFERIEESVTQTGLDQWT